jgi:hypothetical protein
MRVVRRERQELTRKIEKMVNNQIPEVWQEGVDDEGGEEGEAGVDKEDRKMVKNQIPSVWQEGVGGEGGEEREAVYDKEDAEDGEEFNN